MVHIRFLSLFLLITLIASSLQAYDNAHFYRATNFLYEPRLEREYLSTIDVMLHKGSTKDGRNKCHDTVPLFNTWGINDMHELAVGVPKDLSNVYDLIITQLSLAPSRCLDKSCCTCSANQQFATFSMSGEFDILEAIINVVQNFKYGLYFQLYFPIRKMRVKEICRCDNSPTDTVCPNINTPIWQTFKKNFEKILEHYDLCFDNISETNMGDVSILLGWSRSFQKLEVLDFIDLDLQFGVLTPSGAERDENQVFSIPAGYNGHIGAIIGCDFAFGVFEWLNLGMYFNTIVFGSKTKCIRIKTGLHQSGVIKLAKSESTIDKGSVWQVGTFLKFDHFIRGLSFLFGYNFANQNADNICPCDPEKFSPAIASSDEMVQGWKMHTLNFMLEYDFATKNTQFAPRIGAYYNLVVGGKRIFPTNTGGGLFGLDVAWDI